MDSLPLAGSISAIRSAATPHNLALVSLQAAPIANLFLDRRSGDRSHSDCGRRATLLV